MWYNKPIEYTGAVRANSLGASGCPYRFLRINKDLRYECKVYYRDEGAQSAKS